ncbi:hypothetical protein [Roseicella aerolata]|uniref:Uncharacterized protein n=1 Tax=Roseicella aerolata TaxID=2883479 RepID=A0A9X1IES5_9PROT|nr:hypothetical protein [Roseicella aerolata]MCB4823082.1 hypothetical protein [Roseicella aerolata]
MEGWMGKWRRSLALALSEGIPWHSAKAAVVVGSVLNLINKGTPCSAGPS